MRIEAQGLRVERGGRTIFTDLSFAIEAGEALLVTGANGAGKSTLLRTLAGLLPLAAGRIGISPADEVERPSLCHYVGHADALKASLTVAENLDFWSAMLAGPAGDETGRDKITQMSPADALGRLGLRHVADLPAAYLSAGQRRRAALARLLTVPRPIWLLDEPLTALDVHAQAVLADVIKGHMAQGGLLLIATHAALPIAARSLELGGWS